MDVAHCAGIDRVDDRMAGVSSQADSARTDTEAGGLMRFTSPLLLLLFLLVPLTAWMGWPSPGAGRRREFTSLTLRVVIIVCLILSLAGMEIVRAGNELAVVFLMDVSDSMPQQAVDS